MVGLPGGNLLVDTPPELRLQLVEAGIERVEAVWYTHLHADHVHGIDDLRVFTVREGRSLPAYVPEALTGELRSRFPYIFDDTIRAPAGTSSPRVRIVPVRSGEEVEVLGSALRPLPVPHGAVTVLGFRVGGLGYVTDGKRLPPAVVEALAGVDVLVLNALWYGNPHPTHFNVEEAVEAARAVGAGRTFLTHITHRVRHRELEERLPEGVEPAYDGLSIEIPE